MRKAALAMFVSLGLFLGGIGLLALRVPFWSLFLGLPSVQIGIVFIIFTFDKLSQEEVTRELTEIHKVPCALCGQPTLTRIGETRGICNECDLKFLKEKEITSSLD